MEFAKATAGVRKAKKKQVKDELDRIKQAEKKKRRLEKALATSAAIRTELEKKKQKKKEEQERLDEEGAAIAEAVALHVLIEEDSNESTLKNYEGPCRYFSNFEGPNRYLSNYEVPYIGLVSDSYRYENYSGNSKLMVSSDSRGGRFYPQYEGWGSVGVSAGHIAAQAVSSLNIADDARVDAFVYNRVLRG